MEKIEFKLSLLDCMSYPISRYKLNITKPVTEESVMEAIKKIISELTLDMAKIESEEDALESKNKTNK